ncbi:MAG: glycine cleavage system protein GcvH [Rhodothermales bacterium]|nr:glycine cleavage system protein GcvH [Rhodothermales bacterium]
MNYPSDLYYTKEHEWIRIEGNVAVIGITEFAQSELGDIVFIEIEDVGTEVARDEVFGTVEAVKTVSELFAPVSGRIAEINDALDASPEAVNEDAYGKGWMIKMEMSDPSEVEGLLSAEDYSEMVG